MRRLLAASSLKTRASRSTSRVDVNEPCCSTVDPCHTCADPESLSAPSDEIGARRRQIAGAETTTCRRSRSVSAASTPSARYASARGRAQVAVRSRDPARHAVVGPRDHRVGEFVVVQHAASAREAPHDVDAVLRAASQIDVREASWKRPSVTVGRAQR